MNIKLERGRDALKDKLNPAHHVSPELGKTLCNKDRKNLDGRKNKIDNY